MRIQIEVTMPDGYKHVTLCPAEHVAALVEHLLSGEAATVRVLGPTDAAPIRPASLVSRRYRRVN